MQHSFKILYFDLLPPSPFLREANKVIACLAVCVGVLAFAWSYEVFPNDPVNGVVNDVIIVASAVVEIWYLSLVVSSIWRMTEYRRAAPQLPSQIYQVLYPLVGVLIVNTTILAIAVLRRAFDSPGIGKSLYKVLLGELAPLLAFEVPILKNWLPRFEPMRFVNLFHKSLSVLIGRELGTDVYTHARSVVEFQVDFNKYMHETQNAEGSSPISPYYDAKSLAIFQGTLSCLYETSREISKDLNTFFDGRIWSLLDVGGGEGTFTSELLTSMNTTPDAITVVDPSDANVESYRNMMANRFPLIRNVDTCTGTIESMIDDLPTVNCVLASHSLYAAFDQNRKRAANLVKELISKSANGCAVFIMSSRDSYLYTIKRMVLADLHHIDKSSYGEDLCDILPNGLCSTAYTFDSIVDVTALLDDYQALVSWLAYFCRIEAAELVPHFDMCQALVRDTAIDLRCLPRVEYSRLKDRGIAERLGLDNDSKIIYHKEIVVVVPSPKP